VCVGAMLSLTASQLIMVHDREEFCRHFFTRYIREMLQAIVDTRIGCTIAGVMINVSACADDIVLLAPSWVALQFLIDILDDNIKHIDIVCNISKTVCMVVKTICRHKVACDKFPVLCCLVNVCISLMILNILVTF